MTHDDPIPQGPARVQPIRETSVLKALANPVRARIMDLLSVHGAATVSMLADRAGIAVGSVSHHLRLLAEAGLVVEVPELARTKRERWWDRARAAIAWSAHEMDDNEGAHAAEALELAAVEERAARARAWIARRDPDNRHDAASFANRAWLWLSPEELDEFRDEILTLVERYRGHPHEGRSSVLFSATAFPEEP